MVDRRRHQRMPTLSVIKEVELTKNGSGEKIPAIMSDISAGGLAIITFLPLPQNAEIILNLALPGINLKNVKAKIVRIVEKNGTYLAGLQFLNLSRKLKVKINKMALDWKKCEDNLSLGLKIDCSKCSYYKICSKEAKSVNVSHFLTA